MQHQHIYSQSFYYPMGIPGSVPYHHGFFPPSYNQPYYPAHSYSYDEDYYYDEVEDLRYHEPRMPIQSH